MERIYKACLVNDSRFGLTFLLMVVELFLRGLFSVKGTLACGSCLGDVRLSTEMIFDKLQSGDRAVSPQIRPAQT